ncbi:hypothetical protein A3Q56_00933 [Intoshia linei]|uniref:HTH psq-type domain-containing protein n=1 Tax=Intoshia linei TaxID=1819745 RepID=A0A177BCP4_9BILA|nr:hypothetical protein A3Q56_00933 [Intoshia linei]
MAIDDMSKSLIIISALLICNSINFHFHKTKYKMKRKSHSISILEKKKIIDMINKGKQYKDIAKSFNIHRMIVQRIKNHKTKTYL